MNKVLSFSTLVLSLSLGACGSSLSPLTDAQKQEFKATLTSAAGPVGAAKTVKNFNSAVAKKDLKVMASSLPSDTYIPSSLNDDFMNNCDTTYNIDAGGLSGVGQQNQGATFGGSSNVNVDESLSLMSMLSAKPTTSQQVSMGATIKIADKKGLVCPAILDISFSLKGQGDQNGGSADISFAANYAIQSDELKATQDITAFSAKGSGKISGDKSGGSADFSADGSLTSTKNGNVGFYSTIEASGGSSSMDATMKLGLKFPTYTAELKATIAQDSKGQTVEYFVNDEKVTESEFKSYFDKFAATTGTSSQTSTPSAN